MNDWPGFRSYGSPCHPPARSVGMGSGMLIQWARFLGVICADANADADADETRRGEDQDQDRDEDAVTCCVGVACVRVPHSLTVWVEETRDRASTEVI